MHQMVKIKGLTHSGFAPKHAVQNTEVPGKVWVLTPVGQTYDAVLVDAKRVTITEKVRGFSHVEPNLSVEEIITELSRVEKV